MHEVERPGAKRVGLPLYVSLVLALLAVLALPATLRAQQWTTSANGANNINSTNSGNVGVGTSAPQAKLDVEGSSAYNVSGVFSAVYAKGTADYPMALMLDGAGTNDNVARLRALNNGQTKWQLNFGDDVTFYSWFNSTFNQRFSVTAAGNVVFGASSPVFDANSSKFLLFDAGSGVMNGEIGVGSSQSGTAHPVGQYAFVNSYLGGTDKRVATIVAGTDGTADSGNIQFYTWNTGVVAERARMDKSGNFGIGTAAPLQKLQVGTNVVAATSAPDAISLGATYSSVAGANAKLRLWDDNSGAVYGLGVSNSQFDFIVPTGARYVWSVNGAEKMRLDDAGNVTVAGNIAAKYQDVAEWVPSSQKLTAGTVVVLDTTQTNHVLASTKAYDTGVAGVISDNPGVILGQGGGDKLKVATTGRVKIRADATRAPIKVGDLLVTSDAEGVAMKSIPVDLGGVQIHRPGTIIGKALEPLDKGTGEILVLLSLQ